MGVPPAIGPSVTVGMLMLLLYAADFAGVLETATYLAFVIGWGGFAWFAWLIFRGRDTGLRQHALLPMLIIGVTLLWLYRANVNGAFAAWDEFSHWGTVIKALYSADTFHFKPNPLYFQDYPPGTALFSYFVLKLLGYSEGHAFFSYGLILLAFCLPVVYLSWMAGPRWAAGMAMLVIFLVSRQGLGHGWTTTLIDHVLSVMFGGTIAAYLLLRKEEAKLWSLSVMLTALVLSKHAGQSLAILAVAVCGVDMLMYRTGPRNAAGMRRVGTTTAVMVGLLVLPLAVGWSWRNYVVDAGLTRSFSQVSLPGLVAKSMQCCSSDRDIDIATGFVDKWLGLPLLKGGSAGSLPVITADHFFKRIADITIVRGYSPALLFVLFLGASIAGAYTARNMEDKRRLLTASLMLSLGACVFGATQLLFYLYSLSDYEARALASFQRFQNIYYLGWGLATIGLIMVTRRPRPILQTRTTHWVAILVLGITPYLLDDHTLERLKVSAQPLSLERASIRDWLMPRLEEIPHSARVYVVWQGTSGIEFWMIRHEMLPRVTNNDCFSLGPPHFAGDVWSCLKPEAQLAAEWAGYDYVIVGRGLAGLKSHYPYLLADVPNGLDRGILRVIGADTASVHLQIEERGDLVRPVSNHK